MTKVTKIFSSYLPLDLRGMKFFRDIVRDEKIFLFQKE